MPRVRSILFAGGGTGGHSTPLLAVMEAIHAKRPEVQLHFVGLASDVASGSLIAEASLPIITHVITSGKLHRFITINQIVQFFRLGLGLIQAELLVRRLRPDVVFCKGSMVSVPVAWAAARRGIPIFSHETDVVPGLANRMIAGRAARIFTAFPVENYGALPAEKVQYTGQPVRSAFFEAKRSKEVEIDGVPLKLGLPLITVTGGSQGARRLNEMVSEGWSQLLEKALVVHQTGDLTYKDMEEKATTLPAELRERLVLRPFIKAGFPELFKSSSVVVSRAGGTVTELAASGVPAVLVPLSTAAQNHQAKNAEVLERAGAAVVINEGLSSEALIAAIINIVEHPEKQEKLRAAITKFARPEAAETIANAILTWEGNHE